MRRFLALLLVLATVAAACGDGDDDSTTAAEPPASTSTEPPADDPSPADPPTSTVDRAPVDPNADVAALADGINDAGFDLLRTLDRGANGVLGPASIGHALLMAEGAADEPTQAALDAAFGFGTDAHDVWNALDATIAETQSERVTVTIADRMWPNLGLTPEQAWVDLLASRHGADVVPLDLQGDPTASRDVINDWVAERTEDRIPELLPEGFLTPDTVLVLTNAMFFDADWATPFGKYGPLDAPFTRLDGTTVPVEFMVELELTDRRGAGDGFVAAEIPYAGGDYSMLVVVPDEGTFDDFVAGLDQAALDAIDASLSTGPYELRLPKWTSTTTLDLMAWLESVGAAPGSYPGISPLVLLGAAVHAADIEVNEVGTVAAAATALGFEDSGPPEPELTVAADQPFVYLIRHRDSGLVLFAGQVVDPTA